MFASFFRVFIAACSCTIIPFAAGLYYSGIGTGTAFAVLWMTPAVNILALTYTRTILGGKFVLARVVAGSTISLLIGAVMEFAIGKEVRERGRKL